MLKADVIDVPPGRAARVEEAGAVALAGPEDDLDHGKVPRQPTVLAGDAARARAAPVEQAGNAGRPRSDGGRPLGKAPEEARDGGQVLGDFRDDLGDRARV